jgi:hypothetical protein
MSDRFGRLAVTAAGAALLIGYVVIFGYFVLQSVDFVVARHNSRATQAALARTAALPAHFDFVSPSTDVELLGGGWYRASSGSVEAAGPFSKSAAFVYLPVVVDEAATVTVVGKPYLAPGHEVVTIDVSIDGADYGPWTARFGDPLPTISMVVPATAASDGLLELRLDVEPEGVPNHHAESKDKRKLGFRLHSITVEPG